jgi:hypothetical protein
MEQSPAGVGAPPLEKVLPQSLKNKVNEQTPKIEAREGTYNTRQNIPHQLANNPLRSRQLCSFERCCWKHRQRELFQRSESLLQLSH